MKQTFYGDSPQVKEWLSTKFAQAPGMRAHSTLTLADGDRICGAVWLENYNGSSVFAHVAGDGPGWLTRRFAQDVFRYVFDVLGCKKMIGIVRSSNTAAQSFDEGLGFKREAEILDADPDGSVFIYSLKREDCKFLRGRNG